MTNIPLIEPDPDAIIRDLHALRESIVDSFGGDLHRLTADARARQMRSGARTWQRQIQDAAAPSSGGARQRAVGTGGEAS